MPDPLSISVIIPTYNRPQLTRAAISSVLRQTRRPTEILVIDDHSDRVIDFAGMSDESVRVRTIRHSERMGGAAARNSGIDAARGDLVAFLDSDDEWLPHKLQAQVGQMREEGMPSKFLSACNVILSESGRAYNRCLPRDPLNEWILIDECTLQTSGLILPRALAGAVRFDPRLRRHQDWDFVLRACAEGARLIYTHEALVLYSTRRSPNRVSRTKGDEAAASLEWLQMAGPLVSERAKAFFLFGTLVPRVLLRHPLKGLELFRALSKCWGAYAALKHLTRFGASSFTKKFLRKIGLR